MLTLVKNIPSVAVSPPSAPFHRPSSSQKTAFVPGSGVALYPPAEVAPAVYEDGNEEAGEGGSSDSAVGEVHVPGHWLEQKLEEKRSGKTKYLTGRPGTVVWPYVLG